MDPYAFFRKLQFYMGGFIPSFFLNFPSMSFTSDLRMLISQQSSTTPVRPAESINTKTEVFFMRELRNTKIIAVDAPEKEGINHAEQYPQHKPAL